MPFEKNSPIAQGEPSARERMIPTIGESFGASFRLENELVSGAVSKTYALEERDYSRVDPAYSLYESGDLAGYEDHEERFLEAPGNNAKLTAAIKTDIDREKRDRETREASGWTGYGTDFVASIASPTTLLPGGVFVRSGRAGFSLLKSGVSVGAAAAGGVAVQEGLLQGSQQTRSTAESAYAIGGAFILGGVLGAGGAQILGRAEFNRLSKALDDDLADTSPTAIDLAENAVREATSGGAAAARKVDPADFEIEGKDAQKLVAAQAAAQLTPAVRMMNSKSPKAREIQLKLAETHIVTKGQSEGRPATQAAAETMIRQGYARNAMFQSGIRKAWKAARRKGYTKTEAEFRNAAGIAAQRNDFDPTDEFASALAKQWRKTVADPAKLDAIEVGIFTPDIKTKTAPSYFTRIFSRPKIFNNPDGFKQILRDWVNREVDAAEAVGRAEDFHSPQEKSAYIDEVIDAIYDNATGRARADVPSWVVPTNRGPLKARTLNIPDEFLVDFLETDIALVSEAYTRTAIPDIELTRAFDSPDMAGAFKELKEDYDGLIGKAETEKEKASLEKAFQKDQDLLASQRDVIRNSDRVAETHDIRGQLTRLALTWNLVRLLGGQTVSSLVDTANVLAAHGIEGFMRDALPALAQNTRAVKIARHDARSHVTIMETASSARLASMAGLDTNHIGGSSLDKFSDTLAHYFSRFTGIDLWNSFTKQVVAMQTMNRITKNAVEALEDVSGGFGSAGKRANYSKLSKYNSRYMGVLNIPEEMATQIAIEAQTHGEFSRGVWGPNVDAWTNRAAKRTFLAAVSQEADRTIVTPGAADTPLWMNSNTGRLIGQFRRISFASNQRVLISRLQGKRRNLAQFLAVGVPIGMMIAYLKYIERGDLDGAQKLVENPGLWVYEGVDRLGVAAFVTEPSNILDRIGVPVNAQTGFQLAAGDEQLEGFASRYAPRGGIGAVLGPSVGLFEDLKDIAQESSRGELTSRGTNAAIGLVPGGTLPGIKTYMHTEIKPYLQDAVK